MRIPNDTWLGLNIGGLGMGYGDDMITFKADGDDSEFLDGNSRSYWIPAVDDQQNLSGEFVYDREQEEVYF